MPEPHLPTEADFVPPAVRAASQAADAIHKQTYAAPAPQAPQPQAIQPQPLQAQPSAPQAPQPPSTIPESGEPGSWEHRYLAMKGRYDQTQQNVGQLQELLSDMSTELAQVKSTVRQPPARPAAPQPPRRLVNKQDLDNYGPELLSLIQRAARDVVAPELARIDGNTQNLANQFESRVAQVADLGLYGTLDREVANWKQINVDPRFQAWVRLPDVYSGRVRSDLLKDAWQAADAPRVVAFFRGFLAEEQATGNLPSAVLPAQPVAQPQPAIALDMLSSPGRPKPAGGGVPTDVADKPVFTRHQIAAFYNEVRRGVYAGRDQDKMNIEAQIFAAQREGRIR